MSGSSGIFLKDRGTIPDIQTMGTGKFTLSLQRPVASSATGETGSEASDQGWNDRKRVARIAHFGY